MAVIVSYVMLVTSRQAELDRIEPEGPLKGPMATFLCFLGIMGTASAVAGGEASPGHCHGRVV
jgi:hypothetical protein